MGVESLRRESNVKGFHWHRSSDHGTLTPAGTQLIQTLFETFLGGGRINNRPARFKDSVIPFPEAETRIFTTKSVDDDLTLE